MILEQTLRSIKSLDQQAMQTAQKHWNALAKPLHGLGDLEDTITKIAGITGTPHIDLSKKCVVVMCADNGVVEEGISQTGQEVTAVITENLSRGTSTVCHMAHAAHADVIPVDIGVARDVQGEHILSRKVAYGTKNLYHEPAMTREQVIQAIEIGIETAKYCKQQGYRIVATGEMGIGNTTTTAAVTCVLLGAHAEQVTGRGAGLSTTGLKKKIEVVRGAIQKHRPNAADPIDVLSKVGGFDICGLTGLFLGGALYGIPTIIDGAISCAAALCAVRLCPTVQEYLIASHHTAETVGTLLEQELCLHPLLDAHMALGEATGAVCMFGILDMAASLYTNGNTFDDSKIEAYVPLT